ncbi:STAS domain-containing protein [Planosporangium sp. 12N6]|uniref:STAS domain-containing protein n=1 Tax=Planosporangium spinosum TaxID=3402278 RepID=UPI003CF4DAEE
MALDAHKGARFDALLEAQEERLIDSWTEKMASGLRGRLTGAELRRQATELLGALRAATAGGTFDLGAEASAELRAVLGELSRDRARGGFSPSETATSVFALKDAFIEVFGYGNADARTLQALIAFIQVVDQLGLYTFETYGQAREELITEQAEQLLELSTPVVKLWEGVVAVPLVGTLDSARAQVVMEKLLHALIETESTYAIIDITGVPAVDTQVAQHILKTVVAARLMGAECVISGIRPQIAQTIVTLGIQFGDIVTKSNLADALVHAMRASGVDIVRRAARREA